MKNILRIIFLMIALPVVVFEYIILVWFWGGADTFNFFATPLTYIIYLLISVYLKKKLKNNNIDNLLYNVTIAITLPILSMFTVWIMAMVFGVSIIIQ